MKPSIARDLFLKVTTSAGKVRITAHRVWDGARFIASMHAEGSKPEKAEDRFTVSEATEQDYAKQRSAA